MRGHTAKPSRELLDVVRKIEDVMIEAYEEAIAAAAGEEVVGSTDPPASPDDDRPVTPTASSRRPTTFPTHKRGRRTGTGRV